MPASIFKVGINPIKLLTVFCVLMLAVFSLRLIAFLLCILRLVCLILAHTLTSLSACNIIIGKI